MICFHMLFHLRIAIKGINTKGRGLQKINIKISTITGIPEFTVISKDTQHFFLRIPKIYIYDPQECKYISFAFSYF